MNYRWDWGVLVREPYMGWLLSGVRWTLVVAAGTWLVAMVLGVPLGALSRAPSRAARAAATAYVEVFRAVPPLVQLFLWYFVVPDLLPDRLGLWVKRDMPHPEATTACIALGLFGAARVAEQVRAGIASVEQRLMPVALATGMRPFQAFRLVLLPLALRRIVAPLAGESLVILKLSSLSLTIGVLELTAESRHVENYTFQGFEAFGAATVAYLLLGLLLTAGFSWAQRRVGRPEPAASRSLARPA